MTSGICSINSVVATRRRSIIYNLPWVETPRLNSWHRYAVKNTRIRLFPIPRFARNSVIEPCRHEAAEADDGGELPGEGGEFLFAFDRRDEVRDRVVEIHQERHFRFASGGERRSSKA